MEAKKYDMMKREDVRRWFDEMEEYIKVNKFAELGTDLEGRIFALDGFTQLRSLLLEKDNKKLADDLICEIEKNKYYNDIFKAGYKLGVQEALDIKRPTAEPQRLK